MNYNGIVKMLNIFDFSAIKPTKLGGRTTSDVSVAELNLDGESHTHYIKPGAKFLAIKDSIASNMAAEIMGKDLVGTSTVIKEIESSNYYVASKGLTNHQSCRNPDAQSQINQEIAINLLRFTDTNGINNANIFANDGCHSALIDFDLSLSHLKTPFKYIKVLNHDLSTYIEMYEDAVSKKDKILGTIDKVIFNNYEDIAQNQFDYKDYKSLEVAVYHDENYDSESFLGESGFRHFREEFLKNPAENKIVITQTEGEEICGEDPYCLVEYTVKENIATRFEWLETALKLFKTQQALENGESSSAVEIFDTINLDHLDKVACATYEPWRLFEKNGKTELSQLIAEKSECKHITTHLLFNKAINHLQKGEFGYVPKFTNGQIGSIPKYEDFCKTVLENKDLIIENDNGYQDCYYGYDLPVGPCMYNTEFFADATISNCNSTYGEEI